MRNIECYTRHASHRAQQRCIPPIYHELLDRFGEETYDGHGGVVVSFTKRSIRRMERSFGREPVRRIMANKFGTYRVESVRDGQIIQGERI
jgi:hypothetical protein